jgi:ADP-ribosylglycohydrolase
MRYKIQKARAIIVGECKHTRYHGVDIATRDSLDPTGYVVDSMKVALWSFMKCSTFEELLVKAVNFGGDTDTIGAITGGLAGAWYGIEGIPERWMDALNKDVKKEIRNKMIFINGIQISKGQFLLLNI